MFGLYITHPQVRIDPAVPVPQWGLSDLGRARATQAATHPWAKRLARIVSSTEVKAIETAEILARAAGLSFETVKAMHENDRSATGFLKPDAFEQAADWFFAHPQESYRGWERAADAQARIVSAVGQSLTIMIRKRRLPSSAMAASARCSGATCSASRSAATTINCPAAAIFMPSLLRIVASHATGRRSKTGRGSSHDATRTPHRRPGRADRPGSGEHRPNAR